MVYNPLAVSLWTYGAEHELSDWDSLKELPRGFTRAPDYTIVNSNGIAAHPNNRIYRYGGEFNTPPTKTPEVQVDCLNVLLDRFPECTVNHRSNLHIHIRIPGLKHDLASLKKLQLYIHRELQSIINILEPIPKGTTAAEVEREKRRYVSHHNFLTEDRLQYQLRMTTPETFFNAEVPATKKRILWHLQSRLCVNLRQMLETDTIEFRHFPGTIDPNEFLTCIEWCRDFLLAGLREEPLLPILNRYKSTRSFPTFPEFDHEREIGYRATCAHGQFTPAEIIQNINAILGGTFRETFAYRKARAISCGVSRKHMPKPPSS